MSWQPTCSPTTRAQIKAAEQNMLFRQHVDRPMQGMFYQNIETRGLSTRLTFKYPRLAGLMSETEGFIAACQDNVINTLVYRRNVMGVQVPDVSCRACRRAPETLMHLLSACPAKAVSAYIHQHNAVLRPLSGTRGVKFFGTIRSRPSGVYMPTSLTWSSSIKNARLCTSSFSAPSETNIVLKEEEKRTK